MKFGILRTAAFAAIGLFLATAPQGLAAAPAASYNVGLTYQVYFGGAHIAGLAVKIGVDGRVYDMKVRFQTEGWIGRVFPWWMTAYSNGLITEAGPSPLRSGSKNGRRGKKRHIDLTYDGGNVEITAAEPEPAKDGPRLVPASMRRDTLDLAGAILRIVMTMEKGATCTGRIPVFDGRRRYDVILAHRDKDQLKPTRYSPFRGTAENCRISMDRIGGFKKRDDEVDEEDNDTYGEGSDSPARNAKSASVWIGKVFEHAPPLPVRMEFDSRYGSLRAHLKVAEIDASGVKRRLSAAR